MIKFKTISKDEPFLKFKALYNDALKARQKNIEAVCISSFSKNTNEVNSRYVNLKIISDNKFIFFSNYDSPKSKEFKDHQQISAIFYWSSIDVQIRIKAMIVKTSIQFNNDYFSKRSPKKNALAISSKQSKLAESYDSIKKDYQKTLKQCDLKECPDYWGGFSFEPYYFEFWKGHDFRLNKREVYEQENDYWVHSFLQP